MSQITAGQENGQDIDLLFEDHGSGQPEFASTTKQGRRRAARRSPALLTRPERSTTPCR
jgi:hypothetical protein